MNIEFCGVLFISHEYGYRRATKIPFLTDFVLKEAAIWLLHPLRKIAEEYECWNHRLFKHRHILDFHKFALVARRRGHGNLLKHVSVKLRGRDNSLAIVVDLYGCLKHLENSLLCDSRRKQDGEICERREFIADVIYRKYTTADKDAVMTAMEYFLRTGKLWNGIPWMKSWQE